VLELRLDETRTRQVETAKFEGRHSRRRDETPIRTTVVSPRSMQGNGGALGAMAIQEEPWEVFGQPLTAAPNPVDC
jgi:hypothetical protein